LAVAPDSSSTRAGRTRTAVAIAALAVVYACAARLGLLMDAVSGFATLVWPAAGIALFALVRYGAALWPGVFAGAFAVNLWTGAPPLAAAGIAAGSTAEALLGAWAVRRAVGQRMIPTRLSDVVAFVALAAIGSTLISATVGTLSLVASGVVTAGHAVETWRAWWLGDATGDLIFAPLLMAWTFDVAAIGRHARARALEALVLSVALVGAAFLVFETRLAVTHAFAQSYMLFPLLIWASIRFGLRGATAATFAVSMVAIWGTARGHGPFLHERLATSLVFLQLFMAIVSVTTLLLAVAIGERNQAVKSREWLLASVSHDLKNPLNMIGLSTDFLARILPADNDKVQRQLASLRVAGTRMNALVRDLLDLSTIESGHLSLDRTVMSARSIVEEAVEATRAVADSRAQSLHATIAREEPSVLCDRGRILQVLVNLIDNAIKFSPEKSEINVTVDNDAGWVRFSVTDVGPGIAAENVRRVFEPFWRGPHHAVPGTGIGLAIAKTIVEAHGGRIWVTSREGHGSCFCFCVPSAKPPDPKTN
jgi:signal transduction histidine kinase